MPKSKRNRVVPTSQTQKKRPEQVRRLHANIRTACDDFAAIWVFAVQNMRNSSLKQVRGELAGDSRLFMGKTKLMAHALGTAAENSYLPGTWRLSPHLRGEVGLLFTQKSAADVEAYFAKFGSVDFARAGAVATKTVIVPRGELTTMYGVEGGQDDPLPMSIEPTLRKLGIPTRLVKGKIVLEESADGAMESPDEEEGYVVCKEGNVLDSRQTTILKIFGVRMAEFKVGLLAVYDKSTGVVRELGSMDVS